MPSNMTQRTLWIGAGAGIVLAALAAGAVWLWRGGEARPAPVAKVTNQLPGAQDRDKAFPEEQNAPAAGGSPAPASQRTAGSGPNVAVTIAYRHTPQFSLTITGAERTDSRTTTEFYEPGAESPFSILRILGPDNAVVAETRFAVPSFTIFESLGQTNHVATGGDGSIYVVVPLPPGAQATQAVLVSPDGRVFDEAVVTGESTSQVPPWQQWLAGLPALAQESANTNDGVITLVITHEPDAGPAFLAATSALKNMVQNLEPWRTYRDKIRIVEVPNSFGAPVGCGVTEIPGGSFPRCPDEAKVIESIRDEAPGWDAIVVVVNYQCHCGSVFGGTSAYSPILAVGTQISSALMAHELGHAVGQMVDEYLGDLGITSFRLGPNCFNSEQACRRAIAPYQGAGGAQCRAGCSTVSSFRPSNGLMYREAQTYGALEECKLEERLVAMLGISETKFCRGSTPSATPGTFWGWYRGG